MTRCHEPSPHPRLAELPRRPERQVTLVPPLVPETLDCAYAAMGWLSSWLRLNRAGERWPW